jgi:hypothetical protein
MARLIETQNPVQWRVDYSQDNWFEQSRKQDQQLNELQKISDALPPGEVVGAILSWQRADGYAVYRVVKAKPLCIEHIPVGDAWRVEPALIRGITKQDVLDMLARDRAWHAAVPPITLTR